MFLLKYALKISPMKVLLPWLILVLGGLWFEGCTTRTVEISPEIQASPSITHTVSISTATATLTPLIPSPTKTLISILPSTTPTSTAIPSETATSTPMATSTSLPATPVADEAIHIYTILLGSGGPVACGDSLVAINTGVKRSGDVAKDVKSALGYLFVKQKYFGSLYNPAYLSNIKVDNVWFKAYSGVVSVRLSGTYVRSGDPCDDWRVRAQVWSTIRQFPGVKVVDILLNGNLLGDILATGK